MLEELLKEHKAAVLKGWRDMIMEGYPEDTAAFLKKQRDPFANPVGHTICRETETLLDLLVHGVDSQRLDESLDNIMKIRAVQDFSPSRAVAFVYLLKRVIRDRFETEIRDKGGYAELLAFEQHIDSLALAAFDCYVRCRELVSTVRVNAQMRSHAKLLERLTRTNEPQEQPERTPNDKP